MLGNDSQPGFQVNNNTDRLDFFSSKVKGNTRPAFVLKKVTSTCARAQRDKRNDKNVVWTLEQKQ